MTTGQIQWHPEVRYQLASERLVFWRLGFSPTYRREEVREALDRFCEDYGVLGRATYEVFGQHDLLAKFWLPSDLDPDELDKELKKRLDALHVRGCEMFDVKDIITHWFWDEDGDRDHALPLLSDADLDSKPSADALCEIGELIDQFNRGELNRGVIEANELVRTYIEKGLLGIREVHEGITFAIVVHASEEPGVHYRAIDTLGDQLALLLKNVQPVFERALYKEVGSRRFLIIGKVSAVNFFELDAKLIAPIVNQASLSTVHSTRTVTYIGSSPNPMSFSERLATSSMEEDEEDVNLAKTLASENAEFDFAQNSGLKIAAIFKKLRQWLDR